MVRAKQIETSGDEISTTTSTSTTTKTTSSTGNNQPRRRKSMIDITTTTPIQPQTQPIAKTPTTVGKRNGGTVIKKEESAVDEEQQNSDTAAASGTDSEGEDTLSDLDLEYPKLQSNTTNPSTIQAHSPVCVDCEMTGGELMACKGTCQRTFHLECAGYFVPQANFKCDECLSGEHECFICKEKNVSDGAGNVKTTRKCSVTSCGKYYHDECAKKNDLFRKDASWSQNKPAFICPMHSCSTCWAEAKTNANNFYTMNNEIKATCARGRFIQCIRCPTAYHQGEHCLAAGSLVLNSSYIICPAHFKPIKGQSQHNRVNVTWCFVCCESGDLVGCSRCPAAYHATCLRRGSVAGGENGENNEEHNNINETNQINKNAHNNGSTPNVNNTTNGQTAIESESNMKIMDDSWVCEDCLHGRRPLYGQIVWAKVGGYRWWPAQICLPRCLPRTTLRHHQCQVGEFLVKFFGTNDHYWVTLGRCFAFAEGDECNRGSSSSTSNTLMRAFQRACHQAKLAYKEVERLKQLRAPKSSTNKYNFQMIKTNRPVGNVFVQKVQLQDIPKCDCDPKGAAPCSRDSDCMNRLLKYECHPAVCAAGTRCKNQRFVRREYPKQAPVAAGNRGWGLKSLVDIKKGDFVNEYVGELIDEKECKRRLEQAHATNVTSFYFLTIDKDRIIDAGPKGNLARFANHSCEPNMETQKWVVNGDIRVGLFARQDIPSGTELTFNYNLDCLSNDKAPCKCGSRNCSGFIGERPKMLAPVSNGGGGMNGASGNNNNGASVNNGGGGGNGSNGSATANKKRKLSVEVGSVVHETSKKAKAVARSFSLTPSQPLQLNGTKINTSKLLK